MELQDISDSELSAFLALFRYHATTGPSRFFLDLYILVEREGARRHRQTDPEHYSDGELCHAIEQLKTLADDMRRQGASDNYPGLRFVLLAMSSAVIEMEKRQGLGTAH